MFNEFNKFAIIYMRLVRLRPELVLLVLELRPELVRLQPELTVGSCFQWDEEQCLLDLGMGKECIHRGTGKEHFHRIGFHDRGGDDDDRDSVRVHVRGDIRADIRGDIHLFFLIHHIL